MHFEGILLTHKEIHSFTRKILLKKYNITMAEKYNIKNILNLLLRQHHGPSLGSAGWCTSSGKDFFFHVAVAVAVAGPKTEFSLES